MPTGRNFRLAQAAVSWARAEALSSQRGNLFDPQEQRYKGGGSHNPDELFDGQTVSAPWMAKSYWFAYFFRHGNTEDDRGFYIAASLDAAHMNRAAGDAITAADLELQRFLQPRDVRAKRRLRRPAFSGSVANMSDLRWVFHGYHLVWAGPLVSLAPSLKV